MNKNVIFTGLVAQFITFLKFELLRLKNNKNEQREKKHALTRGLLGVEMGATRMKGNLVMSITISHFDR